MISLFKPHMPDLPELDNILHSGSLAYGKYTKEFEEKLKKFFETPYLITTNSFESAISVAVTTLGLTRCDEIVLSPMACLASTQPYASTGMKIKWCDIDPTIGTLDPEYLVKTITPKTKAIVHNHFCGYPGYIDEINSIAKKYGIPVIDDGIECFGSEYKGKLIGNCGTDVTVFSLNAVRIPNTIDGGIVIFKDKTLFEKSLRIRDCGIDRSVFRDELNEINPLYDITEIGYSATMSNVNGYIGSMQMDKVNDLIYKQRRNAEIIKQRIEDIDFVQPIKCKNAIPNYWVFGTLVEDKVEAIKYFRMKSFYASSVHINNNIYSVFDDKRTLKGTQEFQKRFVAIPSGWWLTESDIKY
jgi:dTDP-4-amino-4,6-dideoxygalactose transaminase